MQYARYRTSGFYSQFFPPGVKWLLIINSAIFVVGFFAEQALGFDPFRAPLGLTPALVLERGFLWQLFTYMFIHGGIWHIVLNMLMLWMFGIDLERDWGTRRFLKYYFLCGVGAGISVVVMALVGFGNPYARTIGASGGIFGLLLAYGVIYADRIILLMFLFPMKAKYAVMLFGAVEFLGTWEGGTGISHVAHLGGMLFGYIYLKTAVRRRRTEPRVALGERIKQWRLQRARRKFQVYMRRHGSDRDRWIN